MDTIEIFMLVKFNLTRIITNNLNYELFTKAVRNIIIFITTLYITKFFGGNYVGICTAIIATYTISGEISKSLLIKLIIILTQYPIIKLFSHFIHEDIIKCITWFEQGYPMPYPYDGYNLEENMAFCRNDYGNALVNIILSAILYMIYLVSMITRMSVGFISESYLNAMSYIIVAVSLSNIIENAVRNIYSKKWYYINSDSTKIFQNYRALLVYVNIFIYTLTPILIYYLDSIKKTSYLYFIILAIIVSKKIVTKWSVILLLYLVLHENIGPYVSASNVSIKYYGTCNIQNFLVLYWSIHSLFLPSNVKLIQKPDPTQITCCKNGPNKMCQKSFVLNGYLIHENHPFVLHACIKNETESVQRQSSCKVKADKEELKSFKKFSEMEIESILLSVDEVDFVTFDEWINKYTSKQKKNYFDALRKLIEGDYPRTRFKKSHTKIDEKVKICWNAEYIFKLMKSRNIIAQEELCKIICGPLISCISNTMKRTMDCCGIGLTNQERSEKIEKWKDYLGDYVVLSIDGSAFDSTQNADLQKIVDVDLYKKYIKKYWDRIGVLIDQMDNCLKIVMNTVQIVFAKFYKYIIDGTQASGNMNTSQGNTLRSIFYVKYICKKGKIVYKRDLFFEATGDDIIILLKAGLQFRFIDTMYRHVYTNKNATDDVSHGLGQIAKKVDISYSINGVEYISCVFIENKDGRVALIRLPDRFIQLTSWTLNNDKSDKHYDNYNKGLIRAEAMNIYNQCLDIKFFKNYADALMRVAGEGHINEKYYENIRSHNLKDDRRNISMNSAFEDLLIEKYNTSQIAINEYYDVLRNINTMYGSYTLQIVDDLEKASYKGSMNCDIVSSYRVKQE